MSSRLFQNIREKRGLAYAVFSSLSSFHDAGCLSVYAGTAADKARQVIDLVLQEFCELKSNPISQEELQRAKDYLKGSLLLSLESSTSRMGNAARQEMYFGRHFSQDEIARSVWPSRFWALSWALSSHALTLVAEPLPCPRVIFPNQVN
jgi:predicted Zn-dependent peptidase